MKKILILCSALFALFVFSGCVTSTGQYIWDNRVAVYKVVVKGVTTFATKEQIEDNQLDKVADVIEYVYSVDTSTGKLVE